MSVPFGCAEDEIEVVITDICKFLWVKTPKQWIEYAVSDLTTLLLDHANCEYKAASTGMSLIHRYRDNDNIQRFMARLVREEMLHYEQVLKFIKNLGIKYRQIGPSRYASTLRKSIRTHEPGRLTDSLLVGAIVEARSCERFAALHTKLPKNLGNYYRKLLRSEGRHYKDYMALALDSASTEEITARLNLFLNIESYLIESPDQEFRFHSGVPVSYVAC